MSHEHRTGLNHDVIAGFKKSSATHRVYFHTCLYFIVFASARGPRKCLCFRGICSSSFEQKMQGNASPFPQECAFSQDALPSYRALCAAGTGPQRVCRTNIRCADLHDARKGCFSHSHFGDSLLPCVRRGLWSRVNSRRLRLTGKLALGPLRPLLLYLLPTKLRDSSKGILSGRGSSS